MAATTGHSSPRPAARWLRALILVAGLQAATAWRFGISLSLTGYWSLEFLMGEQWGLSGKHSNNCTFCPNVIKALDLSAAYADSAGFAHPQSSVSFEIMDDRSNRQACLDNYYQMAQDPSIDVLLGPAKETWFFEVQEMLMQLPQKKVIVSWSFLTGVYANTPFSSATPEVFRDFLEQELEARDNASRSGGPLANAANSSPPGTSTPASAPSQSAGMDMLQSTWNIPPVARWIDPAPAVPYRGFAFEVNIDFTTWILDASMHFEPHVETIMFTWFDDYPGSQMFRTQCMTSFRRMLTWGVQKASYLPLHFYSQLHKDMSTISHKRPDVLVLCGHPYQIGAVRDAMEAMEFAPLYFLISSPAGQALSVKDKAYVTNYLVEPVPMSALDLDRPDPLFGSVLHFMKAWFSMTGQIPGYEAFQVAGTMSLLLQALKALGPAALPGSLDSAALAAAMGRSLSSTVLGWIHFNEQGQRPTDGLSWPGTRQLLPLQEVVTSRYKKNRLKLVSALAKANCKTEVCRSVFIDRPSSFVGSWREKALEVLPCSVGCIIRNNKCDPCRKGYYRGPHDAICKPCDARKFLYADTPGFAACLPCPIGATCSNTAGPLITKDGYCRIQPWTGSCTSSLPEYHRVEYDVFAQEEIINCVNRTQPSPVYHSCVPQRVCKENACVGDNEGMMCGQCRPGWTVQGARSGRRFCKACPSQAVVVVQLALVLLFYVAVGTAISRLAIHAALSPAFLPSPMARSLVHYFHLLACVCEYTYLDANPVASWLVLPAEIFWRPMDLAQMSCLKFLKHDDLRRPEDFIWRPDIFFALILPAGGAAMALLFLLLQVTFGFVLKYLMRRLLLCCRCRRRTRHYGNDEAPLGEGWVVTTTSSANSVRGKKSWRQKSRSLFHGRGKESLFHSRSKESGKSAGKLEDQDAMEFAQSFKDVVEEAMDVMSQATSKTATPVATPVAGKIESSQDDEPKEIISTKSTTLKFADEVGKPLVDKSKASKSPTSSLSLQRAQKYTSEGSKATSGSLPVVQLRSALKSDASDRHHSKERAEEMQQVHKLGDVSFSRMKSTRSLSSSGGSSAIGSADGSEVALEAAPISYSDAEQAADVGDRIASKLASAAQDAANTMSDAFGGAAQTMSGAFGSLRTRLFVGDDSDGAAADEAKEPERTEVQRYASDETEEERSAKKVFSNQRQAQAFVASALSGRAVDADATQTQRTEEEEADENRADLPPRKPYARKKFTMDHAASLKYIRQTETRRLMITLAGCVRLFLIVVLLTYPAPHRALMRVGSCVNLMGASTLDRLRTALPIGTETSAQQTMRRLMMDLDVECTVHHTDSLTSFVMISAGCVPVLIFMMLKSGTQDGTTISSRLVYSVFTSGYKPDAYWWEVLQIIRTGAMILTMHIQPLLLRCLAMSGILTVSFCLVTFFRPMEANGHFALEKFEKGMLIGLVMAIFTATLIQEERDPSLPDQLIFTGRQLAALGAFVALWNAYFLFAAIFKCIVTTVGEQIQMIIDDGGTLSWSLNHVMRLLHKFYGLNPVFYSKDPSTGATVIDASQLNKGERDFLIFSLADTIRAVMDSHPEMHTWMVAKAFSEAFRHAKQARAARMKNLYRSVGLRTRVIWFMPCFEATLRDPDVKRPLGESADTTRVTVEELHVALRDVCNDVMDRVGTVNVKDVQYELASVEVVERDGVAVWAKADDLQRLEQELDIRGGIVKTRSSGGTESGNVRASYTSSGSRSSGAYQDDLEEIEDTQGPLPTDLRHVGITEETEQAYRETEEELQEQLEKLEEEIDHMSAKGETVEDVKARNSWHAEQQRKAHLQVLKDDALSLKSANTPVASPVCSPVEWVASEP